MAYYAPPQPQYSYAPPPPPQPVYYPQPQPAPPAYSYPPAPLAAPPAYAAPRPAYSQSASSSTPSASLAVKDSFPTKKASEEDVYGEKKPKSQEQQMFEQTRDLLSQQVEATYQARLLHRRGAGDVSAAAVHRLAEGLRRRGKSAEEMKNFFDYLLEDPVSLLGTLRSDLTCSSRSIWTRDMKKQAEVSCSLSPSTQLTTATDYYVLKSALSFVRGLIVVYSTESIHLYFPSYVQEQDEDSQEERRQRSYQQQQRQSTRGGGGCCVS